MPNYPTAYRAGAAKYGSGGLGFQTPPAQQPLMLAPTPPAAEPAWVPKPAKMDYLPDVPASPAAAQRHHSGASFHDYLRSPTRMSGGTGLGVALGRTLPGATALTDLLAILFGATQLLGRIGHYVSAGSYTFHCGPSSPTPLQVQAAGFGPPVYGDFPGPAAFHAGTVQSATGFNRVTFRSSKTVLAREFYIAFRGTIPPYTNSVFINAHWTKPAGQSSWAYPGRPIVVHAGTQLIDWYLDPITMPVSQVALAPPTPVPAIQTGFGGSGIGGSSTLVAEADFPHPPRKGVRERKLKGRGVLASALARYARKGISYVTETEDVVEALYDALPEDDQIRVFKSRKTGDWVTPTLSDKVRHLYHHFDKIDWDQATINLIQNQIEDYVIGKTSKATDKQLLDAGWKFPTGVGTGPVL